MLNFILYNQDSKKSLATVALMADISKGFNRINHFVIIQLLHDMNCPGWLLKVIIGYLSDRRLVVRQKGCSSQPQLLPGGTGQGTRLGMFLFIILVTRTGFPQSELSINRNIGKLLTAKPTTRPPIDKFQAKFLDDIFFGSLVRLKDELEKVDKVTHPAPLHLRTGHILNLSNPIHQVWQDFNEYVRKFDMKINYSKTKVMIFNRSNLYDFIPQIYGENDEPIEIVESTELLGLVI